MTKWNEKYTSDQREAIAQAWNHLNIRPAAQVVAMAAAGELTLNGEKLPAFTTNKGSVADIARKARARAARGSSGGLAEEAPRDAVEQLRRRLVLVTEREVKSMEGRQRRGGTVEGERIRQAARAVRELAALPGRDDPRPVKPGSTRASQAAGESVTKGGLVAEAARELAAPSPPHHPTGHTRESNQPHATDETRSTAAQHDSSTEGQEDGAGGLSGSGELSPALVAARAASLLGGAVERGT